jgi:hypothetical protein
MFGKLVIWVGGLSLCDGFESTISDAILDCRDWKQKLGKRHDVRLMTADKVTAFCSLDGAGYGFDHLVPFLNDQFNAIDVADPYRFQMLAGDSMDDCKLYCVEGSDRVRLLYSLRTRSPEECWVCMSDFNAAVKSTISTLEKWYAELE